MLTRTAILALAALVALVLATTLLRGDGPGPHIVRTAPTPTTTIAGLPEGASTPAAEAEIADLNRLAGTVITLLLLGSATVLVTLLGVIAAENLAEQGRRLIEVMLGAPPRWLVGRAARRWRRRILAALAIGGAGTLLAALFMVMDAPPGTDLETPGALRSVAALLAVVVLTLTLTTLPVLSLYRREPLGRYAETRHATDPRPRHFGRVTIMTLQLCIAAAILTGAGLLILGNGPETRRGERSVERLMLATLRTPDSTGRGALHADVLEAISRTPGLEDATLATPGAWLGRGPERRAINECGACSIGGMPQPVRTTEARVHAVMPGFFAAHGLALVAGKGFADVPLPDTAAMAAAVPVVISEGYARAHFLDPPVLGRTLSVTGPEGPWHEVVGIVREAPAGGLGSSASRYAVYLPATLYPPAEAELVVATNPEGRSAGERVAAVAALLAGAAPGLDVQNLRPAADEYRRVTGTAPWLGRASRSVGLVAAVVALAGIVGAMRAHLRARRHELGIRAALGAGPRTLRRMVLAEALRIGVVGVGLGLWGAAWIVGLVAPAGVRIFSAPLFAGVALVCVTAMVLAALPGSRVAVAADPREVMKG